MRKRIACVTAAILSISLGVSGCGLIPFEQDIPFLSSRAENVETEKKTEQQTIDEQDADTEKSTEDTQQDDGLNEGEQTDNEDTEEADEKQENPMEQAALMAVECSCGLRKYESHLYRISAGADHARVLPYTDQRHCQSI